MPGEGGEDRFCGLIFLKRYAELGGWGDEIAENIELADEKPGL